MLLRQVLENLKPSQSRKEKSSDFLSQVNVRRWNARRFGNLISPITHCYYGRTQTRFFVDFELPFPAFWTIFTVCVVCLF